MQVEVARAFIKQTYVGLDELYEGWKVAYQNTDKDQDKYLFNLGKEYTAHLVVAVQVAGLAKRPQTLESTLLRVCDTLIF